MTIDTWDHETSEAWNKLEHRLAAYLETSAEELSLLIEMPTPLDDVEGASPYVQLTVGYDGSVHAEATSNHYLDPRYALIPERADQVEALGWTRPTHGPDEHFGTGSANYWVELALPDDADLLALMLVETLRDVYGVPHPSFLVASGFGPDGDRLDEDDLPLGLEVLEAEEGSTPVQVVVSAPKNPDALRDLVEAALKTVVDDDLDYDDDGDLPIDADETTIYVRVEEDSPSIRIFAPLVHGVRWTPRVGTQLAAVNQRCTYAKVVYSRGVVFAVTQLYAMPFVSSHLTAALEDMQELVADLVPELREELRGDVFSPGGRATSFDWDDD